MNRYGYSSVGRFDVFFHNQLLVFQQHQGESLYDSWTRFKDIIQKVPNHSLSIWTLIEIFLKHLDSFSRHIINLTTEGDLRKFTDIGAWYAIEDCVQYDKKCSNPTSTILDETIANPNAQIVGDDMVRVLIDEKELEVLSEVSLTILGDDINQFFFPNVSSPLLEQTREYGYSSVEGDLRKFSDIGAWYAIEDYAQYDKKYSNPISAIFDETIANPNAQIVGDDMVRVQVPRCMAWLDYDEHVNSLSTIDNEVGVTSPESTTQTLLSFEEYTPPMTYPKEVEKTLGTPIEVEPLNKTKLEEVGLNCNHNTPFTSREVHSFDGLEPQPLLNSPSLDVSLGDVIGPEPPIKPHSPDSSRVKVVDYLTIQTPPSPHVVNSHPKGVYSYYNPSIDDPYRFKPGLLGKSVSLCVDISNWEMFDDDYGLESKEVSPLGEELSLFARPNEVERGRILEAHRLESILQQKISQHIASSHNNGTDSNKHVFIANDGERGIGGNIDSDVVEGTNAAFAFMAILSSLVQPPSQVNEIEDCMTIRFRIISIFLDTEAKSDPVVELVPVNRILASCQWKIVTRSQTSNQTSPVTPFVHKCRPPSQVLASLRNVNAAFLQFEGIIKERTTQKPDYVSEWCFDYAKQFVEQQLVPFYDHFKKHIQAANDTFFKEIREFEQIFDDLETEYEQCVLDNKNLTIEKKNLLIKNDCLIAECLEKRLSALLCFSLILLCPLFELPFAKILDLQCDWEHTKCIDTSSASNAIFEINKLRDQLQGKDTTIRNLDAQINIMKVLNVGSTEDGLKVENVSLKRRYDELSKANTHSRTAYTEKINALTAEIAKLKTELSGKKSSGSTASEKPKVLASEPPRTSNRPTQKPPVQTTKKPNVPVNLSTRTKPATESRKPMPKCHTRNHRILPNKSVNARRAADHNRKLNVVDHNQFVIRSLKSVNTKTPQAKHSVNHTKKVWKATRNHNVNTTKTAWRPTGKVVGSVKPQWKPTGRHFALYDNCPLTRIMEPIVEPLELTPSVSSSSKVTMISRFTDCKLSDRKAGSKGIYGIF
ncbi:hypothetical protein Tco_0722739 [Tanacetum coccineum]